MSHKPQLRFTPATLPDAIVWQAYPPTSVGTASGGAAPYAVTVISGLPAGMALSVSGLISGTPTNAGSVVISLRITDSSHPVQSVNSPVSLTVDPAPVLFPDLIYSFPADNPAPPGDVFTPAVSSSAPSANAPALAVLTESGIPGDTLVAGGDQFNSDIKLTFYGQATASNGTLKDGIKKRLIPNVLASRIDPMHVANSMYLAWPVNSNGVGRPLAVNKTELWWAGVSRNATHFDQVGNGLPQQSLSIVGDICRVHGRSLAGSVVYWKPVGAAGQFITPSFVDPYCVEFTVPAGAVGTQVEIWCHNGHGGVRGWGGPLMTTLIAAETYLGANGTNSVTLPAPTGGDDAALFNAATASLNSQGSGTINVPAGIYTLKTKPNVFVSSLGAGIWIKGAGKGQTIINIDPSFNDTVALAFGREGKMSDLTININAVATPVCSWVENVDITSSQNANCLNGPRYLSNCVLSGAADGSTVVVPAASDVTVLGCTFKLRNSCEAAIFSTSGQRFHVVDCTTQDYNVNGTISDHGVGRMFVGQLSGLQTEYYFSRNTTVTLAPDPAGGDQNKGEQFLWDGEAGLQSSMVASATPNSITYSGTKVRSFSYVGTTIFITAAKGLMQRAIVIGESGNTLTLDRNFNVIPDSTSRINITWGPTRLVMYNNNQQGNNNHAPIGSVSPASTASQGFETNGGADIIYSHNTLSNGFQYSWSLFNGGSTEPCVIPLYGILVEGNTVTGCANGARLLDNGPLAGEALTTCGVIQRHNTQSGCIDSDWLIMNGGAVDMCVWENNRSSDATRGVYQYFQVNSPAFINVQVYDSTFSLGTGTFAGSKGEVINGTGLSLDLQSASGQFVGFEA